MIYNIFFKSLFNYEQLNVYRIIAVNYEAKAQGVKRGMMGDDARMKCPSVHLFRVPELRGKADLTRY